MYRLFFTVSQKKAIIVRTEARSLLKNKKLLLDLFILNFLKLSAWYLIPVTIFHLLNSSELSLYMATAAMMTALSGVIPAPGGVGAAEFLFVLLFTPLIGKTQSASAMLIYRFATYILPFILGAIVAATTHSKKNPA
ncbi:TIGR00374 family protein [Eubacterium sp. am_0171]|uniref:flippase-like domain-containing protein n=1 Tax=unclassified Eubacterium (in: firmicutes) TaxID=2624479 RepID=UPI00101FBA9F|nr:flippase-like domain-containing protein [Eubacterium sp. BIOML-A1]MSD08633.1 flippase-like domain-containing protein [Eubacterium sp. BIOML-A2]RYT11766.1 TIGR00374 family protein [Eubacterium sp. am_0171]